MILRHGITIAARQFIKNRSSSFINVIGLTIGLTGFVCIMLFVEHELSFDKFHVRYADTYRVVKDFVNADGASVPDATTPPALSKALRTDLADVETATRIAPSWGRLYLLQYEETKFYETKLIRVDPEFFNVFDFPFVSGSRENALKQIHSIVMTESAAKKYFGNADPIGKTIRMNMNGGTDYEVSGVLKDIPNNSHFTFDLLIPFESRRNPDADWQRSDFYTYVRLRPGADPLSLPREVNEIVKTHLPNTLDQYHVQPLADIHLRSNLKWELLPNGNIAYLRILVLIAVFILMIACINYINLTTAQASKRAKEVGIRKSIGAVRIQLIRQFLAESLLTVSIALVVCFAITSVILPSLTSVIGVDLSGLLLRSQMIRWCLPFGLLLAFSAGFYPAIYLSGFQPLRILRSNFSDGHKGRTLRKGLVVFQFSISSVLIVGTLIVTGQLDFMKQKDMGFDRENIVIVPNVRAGIGGPSTETGSWDDAVRQIAGVNRIARADGLLGSTNATNGLGYAPTKAQISLNFIRIDHDFIPTMNIALKDGRNFSRDFISDTTAIIINEEAARQLGLPTPWIGQKLAWDDEAGKTHDVTVVGIAKDFHFTDLHQAIAPFGFILEAGNGSNFFIRVNAASLHTTIKEIEKVWNRFNPGKPFLYNFQDEYVARLHMNDERFRSLFSIFTVLAIGIACLGLFGLTIFFAESRTKEIGIRKIMGASVMSILKLMSGESIGMIMLSMVVAFPLAYYLMSEWLEGFAYHIQIGWGVFTIAGIASLLMAFLTISYHAMKVATKNPVESLRTE
ncbi:putative ABC transport system permease protein [Chryseolinea serpens]|uniref:Putative ABC transport system permease protein n=1 Tax=Chryseolinea serpens TaxID=947013 RepID=A0A1M5VT74_9BACT|nr:ABC transporter permease [Chryseolinea serpens]SHH78417.1 putative ABC transport system permease protein [Chryseolinea serpens]